MNKTIELLLIIVFAISIFFFTSYIVQLCWNNVVPNVLNANKISYTQAILLYILCRILFGSIILAS